MNLQSLLDSITKVAGPYLMTGVTLLGVIIIGWLLAVVTRAALRRVLSKVELNRRIGTTAEGPSDVESIIAAIGYWLVLLLTIVAAAGLVNLTVVAEPLQALITPFMAIIPKVAGAAAVGLVAWLLATAVRRVLTKVLAKTGLDERVQGAGATPMSQTLGHVAYGAVLLIFLPVALGILEMKGLLGPVEAMLATLLGFLPNLVAAAIIGVVGWFVARILRDIVTGLLGSAGVDAFGERIGVGGQTTLSVLLGRLVYVLVLLPVLIAALDALHIEAISGPATTMLAAILGAIPNVIAAGLILAIAHFVARLILPVLTSLLQGAGLDTLLARVGFESFAERIKLSVFATRTAYGFFMLFAVIEAAGQLGFDQVATIVSGFVQFGGSVLLGALILMIGFALAQWVYGLMTRIGGDRGVVTARIARVAIVGMVVAMGLRAMGIADDIVAMAFGLTLGAVAVAVALAFGLGGRDAAARVTNHWADRLIDDENKK